jgi:glycine dehydrogenase subunit 1
LKNVDLQIDEISFDSSGRTDTEMLKDKCGDDTLCVVLQQPNFFGSIENMKAAAETAHAAGTKFIAAVDPISLGVLKPPADYVADIVVGEGQPLGMPTYCGGETLGLLACRKEFLRQMPGRLVGLATDVDGNRGFVLTLQTREQHIRRERATSNICTNHALNALRAAIYLVSLGRDGLQRVAEACAKKSYFTKNKISQINGFEVKFESPSFREFVVHVKGGAKNALDHCQKRGIVAGLDLQKFYPELKNCLLVCVTETKSLHDIERFVETLKQAR